MIYVYCVLISFGVNVCSLGLVVYAVKRQMRAMLSPPKRKPVVVADAGL